MRFRLLLAVGMGLFASGIATAEEMKLPPGPNRELVYGNCRTCHDLQYVRDSAGITRDSWEAELEDMQQRGLQLKPDVRKKILDYLATYLGPNPPKAPPKATAPAAKVDGKQVFRRQCVACHGRNGKGTGTLFPPLAGNRDIFLDRTFPALVVLNGLKGPLKVGGKRFNGVMPSFAHLSDAKIAAVVNYIRAAWGNTKLRPEGMAAVDAELVKAARAKQMGPAKVHAYRANAAR
jgi:mono/diheme cytochrome c family protein